MCALMAVLRIALRVSQNVSDEELAKMMYETDSPAAKMVVSLLSELGDIPYPEIYRRQSKSHLLISNK